MKLTTLLLIISIVQVSASGFAQKITLSEKATTLKQVFDKISTQTGFDFMYVDATLKGLKPVNIQVKNEDLKVVLDKIFEGQALEYRIEHNYVVVSKRENSVIERIKGKVNSLFQQDSILYKGKVLDEKGQPLPGATITIKGSRKGSVAISTGYFERIASKKSTLVVSYLGYQTQEIILKDVNPAEQIIVKLIPGQNQLGQVDIVSTGYYEIDRTRMTGSVDQVSKEQLQLSNDPNILRRLEGLTPSMDFRNDLTTINSANRPGGLYGNSGRSPLFNLTIRGKNTLTGRNRSDAGESNLSGQVLVVIDNVPSPYSVDAVDPNDVESISILKDAAAASIWGARAANGVIVIKTKRGAFNRPITVGFTSNFDYTEKLNMYYKQYMSTSDYIDAQIFQYNKLYSGTATIADPVLTRAPNGVSPVAEIMNNWKKNQSTITVAQRDAQLDALRGNDVRRDFEKYIQRNAINQNYSLSVDGGSKNVAYRLSAGYNNSLNNTINSGSDRISLNYNTSIHLLNNLDVQANLTYNKSRTNDQAQGTRLSSIPEGSFHPYTRLADEQGNPLPVTLRYRPSFLKLLFSAYGNNILDMSFTPLTDINEGYLKVEDQTLNLGLTVGYRFNPILSANVAYSHSLGYGEQADFNSQNSFYMRDLINRFTGGPDYKVYDPSTGIEIIKPFYRNIPLGGRYKQVVRKYSIQNLRASLDLNKIWNGKHVLTALAGLGADQNYSVNRSDIYYGYDPNNLSTNNVLDYSNQFKLLFIDAQNGLSSSKIPYDSFYPFSDFRTRTFNTFANAVYTFDQKYTLSGTIRQDLSSQFGLGTNKGGTPFYSIGASWNIANEAFYKIKWLSALQLRGSFGYNGNVNSDVSARQIIDYSKNTDMNNELYYAYILNNSVTNNALRPEKVGQLNVGLEFGLFNNRITGVIEFYDKKSSDLLETGRVDPSTGFTSLNINVANLHGWGTDMTLRSTNIKSGVFNWNSTLTYSKSRVKVSKLFGRSVDVTSAGSLLDFGAYNEGADLYRLFAYKWAGLDPLTGDPRGYLNGQPVTISSSAQGNKAYNDIRNGSASNVRHFGSIIPTHFGSFGNSFNYGQLSVSANIMYKLGYYVRRPNSDIVRYSLLIPSDPFSAGVLQGAEYTDRWQKQGDELKTNVPSLTYPTSSSRDIFYYNSEINVLKGDHIRLQRLNLSYAFGKKSWFIKNPRVYFNMPLNIILWRANKQGIDPDIQDFPRPKTYGGGFSANF